MKNSDYKKIAFIGLVVVLAFVPVTAFAAAPGETPGLSSLFWPVSNFILFSIAVWWIVTRKVTPALEQRQTAIKQHLERSAAALTVAEQEIRAKKERLSNIESEKQQMIESFREEAQRLGEHIIESARAAAKRIEDDTVRLAEAEYRKSLGEFQQQVISLATKRAREKLSQKMSQDIEQVLKRRFLESIRQV